MFLPFADTPNPHRFRPFVNWALILANVAVYGAVSLPLAMRPADPADPALWEYLRVLATSVPDGVPLQDLAGQVSAYDLVVWTWGYKPALPQVQDLFASLFLHGGLLHLLGNMLFLWIYGDNVEQRLGRGGYLLAYLGSGVAATLAFAAFAGDSPVPLVGASGAISGVLGMYFVLFPRNAVKVFVFLFPLLVTTVLLPARLVLLAYLLVDNLLPVLAGGGGNVAYGAHIGGFAAGVAVALVLRAFERRAPAGRGAF